MYIEERKNLFRNPRRNSSPYRIMAILLVIVAVIAVMRDYASGEIWPPFIPTPTPTRSVNSFVVEGDTHFQAGNIAKAIESYNQALLLDPADNGVRVKLAQIQVYSSTSLATDREKQDRLAEALAVIDEGKAQEPDNPDVLAVRSFVLNWKSEWESDPDIAKSMTSEAESEALVAIQLDSNNALAKAYYAEILIDEFKYAQAQDYIAQAREDGEDLMDVRRVQAFIYEMFGEYNLAIEWYQRAIEVNPNITFLYNRVGVLLRHMRRYDEALEFFSKEVNLNNQQGISDPLPYMAIANTYVQMGEAMAASRNAYRALEINPYNADTYGKVGQIYYKARNYEGAEMVLKCAVEGCTREETCLAREEDPCGSQITTNKLPLTNSTVSYYYFYGSVLAGLHREGQDDRCAIASDVFRQIREQYKQGVNEFGDTVLGIVSASEAICGITPGQLLPTARPSPTPLGTNSILPTETPMFIPTLTPAAP